MPILVFKSNKLIRNTSKFSSFVWSLGVADHWSLGVADHWSLGVADHWSIRVADHWSLGVADHWSHLSFGSGC